MTKQRTEFEEQQAKRAQAQEKARLDAMEDLGKFPANEVYMLSLVGLERLLTHIHNGIDHEQAVSVELIDSILSNLKYRVYDTHDYAAYRKALEMSELAVWLRRENLRIRNEALERKYHTALLQDMKPGKNLALINYLAMRGKMEMDMVQHERGFYPHVEL